jgi:peptide/nickel transport system substrate-binding protein
MGKPPTAGRRTYLTALATGAGVAAGGCLGRVRSLTGWQSPEQVQLRIKTVPNDADPYALSIARTVADWFRSAGIDVGITPAGRETLLRDVLLNDDFDVFVARSPAHLGTPDALYALLHSRFSTSQGWQNPFGYTNLEVDDLLAEQRRTGGEPRRETVEDLQRRVADTQPFSIIGLPDDVRTARRDAPGGWMASERGLGRSYAGLDRSAGAGSDETKTLRLATTDARATENLNPLAVEFRRSPDPVDLLYDSLGTPGDGETVDPWLAASWSFPERGPEPVARVRLREDLEWHDGEPLTVEDVVFTHELLADTALGNNGGDPIPPPRYRGERSLIDAVDAVDARTVEFRFVECEPRVAVGAFAVPILPEHVWADRAEPSSVGGISVGGATEALVTNNVPPVGSGPLSFVRNTPGESLILEPFREHFAFRDDGPVAGDGPAFDRLRFQSVGSDVTAVAVMANGDADVTWYPVGAANVARIGRSEELDLLINRPNAYYIVGYNTRRQPLTNPRFRRALAHLIDKGHLAAETFGGYLQPAASPLAGTGWLPPDLEWDEEDPVTPFAGSDGELDVEAARNTFRDIGYRYDDDRLVEE